MTPQTASTLRPLISSKEKLLGRFREFTKQRQEEEEGEKDKDEKKEVELELQNLVTTGEQAENKHGYAISSGHSFTESLINFDLQKH